MTLKTKALLLQIGWYVVFIWLMMFILSFFITNRGILYSFISGFLGVLLSTRIKMKNNQLKTTWWWMKK